MKSILLIDIGAGPLPSVTPVPVKQSAWFPVLHTAPPLPTPGGVTTSPVADGILVEWADSGIAGAVYVVSRAPAEAGPYVIVHRTTGLRYLHTDNSGEPSWFRVAVELNGRESPPSAPVEDLPVDVSAGIAGADQAAADALAAALAADAKAAKEIIDRQTADAVLAAEAAVLRSQVGDILQADVHDPAMEYPKGDLVQFGSPAKLYRALLDVPVGIAITDTAYWELIGNYASLGEAVSATAALSTATASELEAVSQTVTRHEARMPTGTGKLTTEARVTSVESAAATATSAVGQRVGVIEARVPAGTDKLANEARVVSAEQAAASATGAVAGRLSTVEGRMPSGTGALETRARVDQVDQASVDRDNANAAAITRVSAASLAGLMPIEDPGFEAGDGWTGVAGATVAGPLPVATARQSAAASADYVHSGFFSLRVNADAATRNIYSIALVPMVYGSRYRITLWVRSWGAPAAGAYVRAATRRYGIDGAFSNFVAGPAGTRLDSTGTAFGWTKLTGVYTPDANTGSAHFAVQVAGLASGSILIDDYTVELISEEQEQQAAVTQTMRADVDSVTGTAKAIHGVTLDVNGHVSGTRSENDGTKSSFSILATVFRVISAVSGMGMEWQDGYLRIWRGSGQLLLGYNFGSGDLIAWVGPNVGSGGANKSNGIAWLDTTANAYFGGSLTAGVPYHPSYATFAASPLNVMTEVGPFLSMGLTKRVTSQFRFRNFGSLVGNLSSGHGATFNGVVTIYRKVGTGAWTSLTTYPVTGVKSAIYSAETNRTTVNTSMSGSITYTDTGTSTADHSYRATVTAFSDPSVAGATTEGEVTIASREG